MLPMNEYLKKYIILSTFKKKSIPASLLYQEFKLIFILKKISKISFSFFETICPILCI